MTSDRRAALLTGVLFLVTFVTAILALFVFYDPVLNDADYIVGAGEDTRVAFGAVL